MRSINNYSDFLSALSDKQSEDSKTRNEAKNALGIFKQKDPQRFSEYKASYEGIEIPKPIVETEINQKRSVDYQKERYIQEHPDIDETTLRKKAFAKLKKCNYGLGLRIELPSWIDENEVYDSINKLSLIDIITKNGNLVRRETLQQKCIQQLVIDRRFDEGKLRDFIINVFNRYYNQKILFSKTPYLYEPMIKVIKEKASVTELIRISDGIHFRIRGFFDLVESYENELLEEGMKILEEREEGKQEKIVRKKARKKAKKAVRKHEPRVEFSK